MRDRLPFHVLLAVIAIVPVACGGSGGGDSAAPPSTAAPAAETAPASEAKSADAEGGFGVAECDAFFEKYFACIDANVPEAARAATRQAAEATRKSLQDAADQPGGAEHLAQACTSAAEAAKQSMAAFNCAW